MINLRVFTTKESIATEYKLSVPCINKYLESGKILKLKVEWPGKRNLYLVTFEWLREIWNIQKDVFEEIINRDVEKAKQRDLDIK